MPAFLAYPAGGGSFRLRFRQERAPGI